MPERDGVDRDKEVVRIIKDLEVVAADLVVREDSQKNKGEERYYGRERHGPIVGAPSVRLGLAVRRVVHRYLQDVLREYM